MNKIIAIIALSCYGCANATSNDIHVELLTAPDAATCYVIVQNGEAKGGNCK